MEDFQERVVEELEELELKIAKLKRFISTGDISNVSDFEQSRLILQFKLMEAYALVLEQRIEAFDIQD